MAINIFLRKDVSFTRTPENGLLMQSAIFKQEFQKVGPGTTQAIESLARGAEPEMQLLESVIDSEGFEGMSRFSEALRVFRSLGLLGYQLRTANQIHARLIPYSHSFSYEEPLVRPELKYRLSRFAFLRINHGEWTLECPLGYGCLELKNSHTATIAMELREARSVNDLLYLFPGSLREEVEELIVFLLMVNCLESVESPARVALDSWEFHDLLFHARSRLGRHDNPYGATFRFGNEIAIPPVTKPAFGGKRIPLSRPDLSRLSDPVLSLNEVIESRTSIRNYADVPVSLEQLGEFLYRTGRVKKTMDTPYGELCSKPYPSGGSLYELEMYVLANQCQGLDQGVYHYAAGSHELEKVSDMTPEVSRMVNLAWITATSQSKPQIKIVLTARFQRLAVKYQSVAYALILKHVGVLYNHMYLVATAMGLAPCALGGGDSELFAKISGLDYYEESSVGEFLLGQQTRLMPTHG